VAPKLNPLEEKEEDGKGEAPMLSPLEGEEDVDAEAEVE